MQVDLQLPDGAEIIMGKKSQDIGHLAGRDERTATWSPWLRQWSDTKKQIEWLVRAPKDSKVGLSTFAQRAGRKEQEIVLS